MPYPDNLDHHFVVDPTKFDFYMMDCYRHLAENRSARVPGSRVPGSRNGISTVRRSRRTPQCVRWETRPG
jgi:hypothetical protein